MPFFAVKESLVTTTKQWGILFTRFDYNSLHTIPNSHMILQNNRAASLANT